MMHDENTAPRFARTVLSLRPPAGCAKQSADTVYFDVKTAVKFFSGILFLLASVMPSSGGVVFNELLYHPNSTNVLEEWIELYNTAPTNVNLSGWRITKGIAFSFPTNTMLAAGGYLVVAADGPTFASKHPGVANFVAGWSGTLGHSLQLSDKNGQVINSIEFYDEGDWAVRVLGAAGVPGALDRYGGLGWVWFAPHGGGGASLELINPNLANTHAQNWGPNTDTDSTPGRVNSIAANNVAPFITAVGHSPGIPPPTDPVTITTRVVDEQTTGLTVTLHWRVDGAGSFTTVTM